MGLYGEPDLTADDAVSPTAGHGGGPGVPDNQKPRDGES